jgi:hypothetical protein
MAKAVVFSTLSTVVGGFFAAMAAAYGRKDVAVAFAAMSFSIISWLGWGYATKLTRVEGLENIALIVGSGVPIIAIIFFMFSDFPSNSMLALQGFGVIVLTIFWIKYNHSVDQEGQGEHARFSVSSGQESSQA